MPSRPHILLLLTDQQAASTLGCHGNPAVTTPQVDRLAAEGVRFDCNTSNCPVCMPARASLLTGRSPEAHGVFRNGFDLDPARLPLFSTFLRDSGYRTVWTGKHHWRCQLDAPPPTDTPYFGFDQHHLTDDNQIGPYFDWICAQGDLYREMVLGTLFNLPRPDHPWWHRRDYLSPEAIAAARRKHIEPRMPSTDKSINYWLSPLPDELTQNAWIADCAIDTIQSHSNPDQPLFLAASFVDPHDPYNPTEKFAASVDPALVPPPKNRPGEHDTSPPHYQRYVRAQTEHAWVNRVVRQTPDEWRALRTAYFAKVNAVDHHVGRILAALETRGLADDTLVVFTSDHGDMMGDHGMITKGDFHYDACIRTPLVVRPPRALRTTPGRVVTRPTSLLDLAPTFLAAAGLGPPPDLLLEGENLLPVLTGESEPRREFAVVEIFATVDGTHHPDQWAKTLRNSKWRYTWFPGDLYGQLFDLESDPDEFENLWGHPSHSAIQAELKDHLFTTLQTRCAPLPSSRYPV